MNERLSRIADLVFETAIGAACVPFLFGAAFVGCLWGATRVGFSLGYAHVRGKLG